MKRLALLLTAFLLAAAPAWGGTAYTSIATGNWNSNSTWSPSGIPGNGDTASLANGFTVTCPAGVSCVIGTSPTDDTGTVALNCTSTSGTGVLIVYGNLTWKGPVRQCNANWNISSANWIGTGDGNLHYDATAATTPSTALYTWQISQANSSSNAVLLFSGNSTHRVKVDSVSNVASGGFGNSGTAFTDGGNMTCSYADIDYQGAASTSGFFLKSRPSTAAGILSFDNCNTTNSAQIVMPSNIGATSSLTFTHNRFTLPTNTSFTFQIEALTAKTTGTRIFTNNYVVGGFYMDGPSGGSDGFSYDGSVFDKTFTVSAGMNFHNGATASSASQVVVIDRGNTDPGEAIPAGTFLKPLIFRHCECSNHNTVQFLHPSSNNYRITNGFAQFDAPDQTGDWFSLRQNPTSAITIGVDHFIFAPGPNHTVGGSLINNSSGQSGSNTIFTLDHVTFFGGGSVGGTVYGFGVEASGTTLPAGGVAAVTNNIDWRDTSGTGPIMNSASTATVSANSVAVADYNEFYNITGTEYGNPYPGTAMFVSPPPGVHDFAVNPTFFAPTRNLYSYDTDPAGLNHAVGPTWVTATVYNAGDVVSSAASAFYQSAVYNYRALVTHTSGATTVPGTGSAWAETWEPAGLKYIIDGNVTGTLVGGNYASGTFIDYARAGMAIQNSALHNTASDGTDVGAVPYLSPSNGGGFFMFMQ